MSCSMNLNNFFLCKGNSLDYTSVHNVGTLDLKYGKFECRMTQNFNSTLKLLVYSHLEVSINSFKFLVYSHLENSILK